MQINKIDQNTNFKSQIVPNPTLQRTFSIAVKQRNNIYAQSLEKILNNGKNEVISFKPNFIRKDIYKGMDLCIDGEPFIGLECKYLSTGNQGIQMSLDMMALLNILANLPRKEFAECKVKDAIPKLRKAESQIFKKQRTN